MGGFLPCKIEHRDGTIVTESVDILLEQMDLQEAVALNAQAPYDAYSGLIQNQILAIWHGDLVTNLSGVVDPDTNLPIQYRVMGPCEPFTLDDHCEFKCMRYVGDEL